ncbi:MAG: 1-phosphofructokinase family hexose kinase [Clostridiales bacterium]|nr:1-phosphofructokinase family hexose kinase [Clostridiales bacterium]
MYLTLTLNPSIDCYGQLKEGADLVSGNGTSPATNRLTGQSFEVGGKGINVAKILNRLTEKDVCASGFTASFTGSEVIRDIESEGIKTAFIDVPGSTRINFKITDGHGNETEINGPGPAVCHDDVMHLISLLSGLKYDTLFISGSMPSSLDVDTYHEIASSALNNEPGLRLILDFEGEALLRCLPLNPFLIKPNTAELSALTGKTLTDDSSEDDIKEAALMLAQQGASNVLISAGANGAYLLTSRGDFHHVPGIRGEVVSTIGAGDTMLASFVHAIDKGMDIRASLEFSNKCAALAAFTAGLPDEKALSNIN